MCDPFPLVPGMSVFDPTMGEGALLCAAEDRLARENLRILGCDIDFVAVKAAHKTSPHWSVDLADIYSASSRLQSAVWQSVKRDGVDLVVMNPPFSYRGARRQTVSFRGVDYLVTPALAALATVLDEVQFSLGVGIVLPEGSYNGQANQAIWSAIRSHFDVIVVRKLPRGSFPDAKATSVLLTILPRAAESQSKLPADLTDRRSYRTSRLDACRCVEVVRGRVRNNYRDSPSDGHDVPFIHTTNLQDGEVVCSRRTESSLLATDGPMLLLPRVGKFYPKKVAVTDMQSLVLSDCVIAMRMGSQSELELLKSALLHPSISLESAYTGTGAPYITLRGLMARISDLGFLPKHVPASNGPFGCTCQGPAESLLMNQRTCCQSRTECLHGGLESVGMPALIAPLSVAQELVSSQART